MKTNLLSGFILLLILGLSLQACDTDSGKNTAEEQPFEDQAEEGFAAPTVPITGTYSYELPDDAGTGELQISQLDNETLRYELMVVGGPPAHNQGMMEGEAWFGKEPNTAVINAGDEENPCEILLTFDGKTVTAKTLKGDPASCGFGNGVMADGPYKRTSSDDPFLPVNATTSIKLQGKWVSADDPKSEIHIDGGKYIESYDGDATDYTYEFLTECGETCGNIEGMSCLMLKGQFDATCYAIVKVTDARLEMSLVGGRGNTLVYNRK